jgi:hypothetical protein
MPGNEGEPVREHTRLVNAHRLWCRREFEFELREAGIGIHGTTFYLLAAEMKTRKVPCTWRLVRGERFDRVQRLLESKLAGEIERASGTI